MESLPDNTSDDVLLMLDALLAGSGGGWWDEFFADRSKLCPFFVEWPDENLVAWLAEGAVTPGRVLELGCGHGRNATYLASLGCSVDAVDLSASAIEWARERAKLAGAPVGFQRCSIFDATFTEGSYDLVYDSGCFHHLAPHRRKDYAELVRRALKPGGSYGLVCFRPEGGSGYTDQQVYERASLGGGLGYSEDRLRAMWDTAPFSLRALRQMKKTDGQGPCFGADFLWALLAVREAPDVIARRRRGRELTDACQQPAWGGSPHVGIGGYLFSAGEPEPGSFGARLAASAHVKLAEDRGDVMVDRLHR